MDRMNKISGRASPLLIALGPKDKENVANPDVMLKTKSSPNSLKKKTFLRVNSKMANKNIDMIKNQINNMNSGKVLKKQITAEDLTTQGSPGDGYWEQLSESRRVALEESLKENAGLHSKIMELEYENTKLKAMLAEAKTSISILTELLNENEDSGEEDELDVTADTQYGAQEESDSEDASFTSL